MKKLMLLVLMAAALTACAKSTNLPQTNQNANDTAPYPKAEVGYTRYAIHLPALADEANARVEVLIGKEMNVDCNSQLLAGVVKQQELTGWGYNYYVVESNKKGTISTLMACPENATKTQFVTIGHNLGLLNYNSQLPMVFYVPNDLTVKYRVWQADAQILQANAE